MQKKKIKPLLKWALSLPSMGDLEMGSVHALPSVPRSAREADVVCGPACDGMSPLAVAVSRPASQIKPLLKWALSTTGGHESMHRAGSHPAANVLRVSCVLQVQRSN